ncbi:hypothetical protein [Aureivirga sp. CE67]|uniref:hypothetical protein n=1 Tax=Aureivirga sp. CE67 TaxID=1788983 RepID=UPI0018C970CF|nr:hypothetical protein [Aureivirga sp. CE67]
MKHIYFLIIIFFSANILYAQEKDNYLEREIVLELYKDYIFHLTDNSGNIINDFCFLEDVEIKYTELNIITFQHFTFYSIKVNKENIISKNNLINIHISETYPECYNIIIAKSNYNNFSSRLYKLKGLQTNDLLNLINDISVFESPKMSIKKIIQELNYDLNDYIDIKCLYKSFHKMDLESKCVKSNCLIRDTFTITFSHKAK